MPPQPALPVLVLREIEFVRPLSAIRVAIEGVDIQIVIHADVRPQEARVGPAIGQVLVYVHTQNRLGQVAHHIAGVAIGLLAKPAQLHKGRLALGGK